MLFWETVNLTPPAAKGTTGIGMYSAAQNQSPVLGQCDKQHKRFYSQ